MIEIAELIATGRSVVLTINNIEEGQEIDGKACTGRELKDLNRARAYLAEVADRNHVPVYKDVVHATLHCIKLMNNELGDPNIDELVKRTINEKPLLAAKMLPPVIEGPEAGPRSCELHKQCVLM